MKKINLIVLLAISLGSIHSNAQSKDHTTGPVKWMSFEEAVEKSKTEKRKIFIDVYTYWCGWCKVMDKSTFPDPEIAKLLNENFYPVKFDAEQTADINFDGHTFKYVSQGNRGVHQLAASLLNNQMSYPNFVFLDENFKMIGNIPGYRKPDEFHLYLSFIGLDYYQKTSINDYQKEYKSPYTSVPQKN
jgi:thioredoxin-related protein